MGRLVTSRGYRGAGPLKIAGGFQASPPLFEIIYETKYGAFVILGECRGVEGFSLSIEAPQYRLMQKSLTPNALRKIRDLVDRTPLKLAALNEKLRTIETIIRDA